MKVSELMEQLGQHPAGSEVVIYVRLADDDGFDLVTGCFTLHAALEQAHSQESVRRMLYHEAVQLLGEAADEAVVLR